MKTEVLMSNHILRNKMGSYVFQVDLIVNWGTNSNGIWSRILTAMGIQSIVLPKKSLLFRDNKRKGYVESHGRFAPEEGKHLKIKYNNIRVFDGRHVDVCYQIFSKSGLK